MNVTVRLFAGLRERAGWSRRELEGVERVGDVWAALELGEEPERLLDAVNSDVRAGPRAGGRRRAGRTSRAGVTFLFTDIEGSTRLLHELGADSTRFDCSHRSRACMRGAMRRRQLEPLWSPSGGKVAFVRGGSLYVMNADGSGRRQLADSASHDIAPTWSPDGRKIAFSKSLGGWERGSREIFVVDLDGSGLRRLTRRPGHDDGPVWSPALTG